MYRKYVLLLLPALLAVGLFGAACSDGSGSSNDDGSKLRVATTLPLFADVIRQVGGDRVTVEAIYPADSDPHTFEPSPRDVQKITRAKVVFVNGLDLEPAGERLIEANIGGNVPLVRLAEEANIAPPPNAEDNPHVWMSLRGGRAYARIIRDTLTEVDPAGAATYAANYDRYSKELDDVETYQRQQVDKIPQQNRRLITTHDAFPYLAADLGFAGDLFLVEAPGGEPSPADVNRLETLVRDSGVPAVFVESQLDSEGKLLTSVANRLKVKICQLYSDSLDNKVDSYVKLLRYDAEQLALCLGKS